MSLLGKKIAIPETRQLDVLARMLEKQGVHVIRCPLVSIHDSPKRDAVHTWLQAFIDDTPDNFIILTGEGVRRLSAFAERCHALQAWQHALSKTRKIARGPKPGKALRELGLRADQLAEQPTTAGVIATLKQLDITGQTVAVQLYGEEPNPPLMDYLASIKIKPRIVAPYIYARESEDAAVIGLIEHMATGDIDMICFTSQPQLKRLQAVARKSGLNAVLEKAMERTQIAAVGPVVAQKLLSEGYTVAVAPQDRFFMGDLVSVIQRFYS